MPVRFCRSVFGSSLVNLAQEIIFEWREYDPNYGMWLSENTSIVVS